MCSQFHYILMSRWTGLVFFTIFFNPNDPMKSTSYSITSKTSVKTSKTQVDSASETSRGIKTKSDSTAQSIETQAKSALTKKTSVGIKQTKAESTSEMSSEIEPDQTSDTQTKTDSTSDTQLKTDSTQETKTGAKTTKQMGAKTTKQTGSTKSEYIQEKQMDEANQVSYQLL